MQGTKISTVNNLAPASLPTEQSSDGQYVQVKSERGRRKSELFRNPACRRAFRSLAHQEPDDVKPGFLGEGRETLNYS